MWYCYLILHPITKRAVYVGVTCDVDKRARGHQIRGCVAVWAKSLGDLKNRIEIVVVAYFMDRNEAGECERRLIAAIPDLLNVRISSGGRPRIGQEHLTAARRKPWETAGVSRKTWYKRRKAERGEK